MFRGVPGETLTNIIEKQMHATDFSLFLNLKIYWKRTNFGNLLSWKNYPFGFFKIHIVLIDPLKILLFVIRFFVSLFSRNLW